MPVSPRIPATVRGERVLLRVLVPQDYDALRLAEMEGPNALGFRHRGATPSPEQFVELLWRGVLSQFMICDASDGEPFGMVSAYGADMRNGHCYVAALMLPGNERSAVPLEGMGLFFDYLFSAFPFRKIFAEVSEANLAQFASGLSDMWEEEARFKEFEFTPTGYADKFVFSLSRSRWNDHRTNPTENSKLLTFLTAHGQP